MVLAVRGIVGLFLLVIAAYFIVPPFLKDETPVVEEVAGDVPDVAESGHELPPVDPENDLRDILEEMKETLPPGWASGLRRYPEDGTDLQALIGELPARGGILVIGKGVQVSGPVIIDRPMRLLGASLKPSDSTLRSEGTELITIAPGVKDVEMRWLTLISDAAEPGQTIRVRDGASLRISECIVRRSGDHRESVALRCDAGSQPTVERCEFDSDATVLFLECGTEGKFEKNKITHANRGVEVRGTSAAPVVRELEITGAGIGMEFSDGAGGIFDQVTVTEPRDSAFAGVSGESCEVRYAKISLTEENSVGIRGSAGATGVFRDVRIVGSDLETGILLTGSRQTFENVVVTGGRYGVVVDSTHEGNASLRKCQFREAAESGLFVRGQGEGDAGGEPDAIFRSCQFVDSRGAGAQIRSGGVRLEECEMSGNLNAGVAITGTGKTELLQCRFTAQKADAPGVLVATEKNVDAGLLDGCTFEKMNGSGIEIRRGTIRANRCTFSRGKTVGLMVLRDGGGVFGECVFREHLLAGAQIESGPAVTFTKSRFLQNQNGVLVSRDVAGGACVFDRCEFLSNKLSGVEIRGSGGDVGEGTGKEAKGGTLFVECTIGYSGESGALCAGRECFPVFRNCQFENNPRSGVVCAENAFVTVRDSKFADSEFGVRAYGGGGGSMENNSFERMKRRLFVIEKDAGALNRTGNRPADE
ncbi:MAG: right-handed parallel beta-helix repeat-containing protein [Planctomycetia bacterium]|nr:right-handed parallel beta-helix repeat-containing protein [Planctomycetia bacterium]